MKTLKGTEAIEFAREHDMLLFKHSDPTEGFRDDVTIEEAEDIAREDGNLIYLEVDCHPWETYEDARTAFFNSGYWDFDWNPHTIEEIHELVATKAYKKDICLPCAIREVLTDLNHLDWDLNEYKCRMDY